MLHTLTLADLHSDDARALYVYFSREIHRLESRLASQNRLAAANYIKSLEMCRASDLGTKKICHAYKAPVNAEPKFIKDSV